MSHPVRVRGLKRAGEACKANATRSHPVRVRGLKQDHTTIRPVEPRRTPCGCVG